MCSITRVMGREGTVCHRLADLLISKHGWTYSTTLSLVHCVLAFPLLQSAIMYMYMEAEDPSLSGPLLLQLRLA